MPIDVLWTLGIKPNYLSTGSLNPCLTLALLQHKVDVGVLGIT